MPKIYFIDVTNRDGLQTAKLGLSKLEKTLINIYLNEIGVFQSEFGFPTTKHESPSPTRTKLEARILACQRADISRSSGDYHLGAFTGFFVSIYLF